MKDAVDAWWRHGWHGRDDVRRAKALRDYVPSIETKGMTYHVFLDRGGR